MSWLIGFLIAFLVIDTVANVFNERRLECVERELVAFRAQFSELSAMRSTTAAALSNTAACAEAIDKLRGKQEASTLETSALRMSIQALVIKLTERRKEIPPPSSSGVRPKNQVHFLAEAIGQTACGERSDRITAGFDGRGGPVGWTSDVEKVTCPKCASALDNGETTVVSRVAS